jgi:hypothetical protein
MSAEGGASTALTLYRLWREKRGEASPEDLTGNLTNTRSQFAGPIIARSTELAMKRDGGARLVSIHWQSPTTFGSELIHTLDRTSSMTRISQTIARAPIHHPLEVWR